MIERADMPGPGDAGINRRETMQRHQHRRPLLAQPRIDHLVDAAMIGIEDRPSPRLGLIARQTLITLDGGRLADARDRAWRRRRPVAVDHQPRVALRDQMRIELLCERLGHAGNADVPGDMPRQFVFRQAEIAEHARDQPAVMIASQQERRGSGRVIFVNRRNIPLAKE